MPHLLRPWYAAAVLLIVAVPVRADDPPKRPACILLIRHAEKPDDDEDESLSKAGRKRAEALYQLFEKADRRKVLPRPDFIFAAHNSKNSRRSVETVKPLAKKLGLSVDDAYRSP